MYRITWTLMNEEKDKWGPGPWHDECDRELWPDPATNYACLVNRNDLGTLCGYVGVPREHPWYGTDYDNIDASVHGGLTFSGFIHYAPEEQIPGMNKRLWWAGFDCAHYLDVIPAIRPAETALLHAAELLSPHLTPVYKTIGYVRQECRSLAKRAAEDALRAKNSKYTRTIPFTS